MTAAPARVLSSVALGSRIEPSTRSTELSLGKKFPAPNLDPKDFCERFPSQWQAFLHAYYRNQIEVALVYGVTEKAAEKWWNGVGGPRGAVIALAATINPAGFQDFLAADI